MTFRVGDSEARASGAKLTRACVPRTVNGTGHAKAEHSNRVMVMYPSLPLSESNFKLKFESIH